MSKFVKVTCNYSYYFSSWFWSLYCWIGRCWVTKEHFQLKWGKVAYIYDKANILEDCSSQHVRTNAVQPIFKNVKKYILP